MMGSGVLYVIIKKMFIIFEGICYLDVLMYQLFVSFFFSRPNKLNFGMILSDS